MKGYARLGVGPDSARHSAEKDCYDSERLVLREVLSQHYKTDEVVARDNQVAAKTSGIREAA